MSKPCLIFSRRSISLQTSSRSLCSHLAALRHRQRVLDGAKCSFLRSKPFATVFPEDQQQQRSLSTKSTSPNVNNEEIETTATNSPLVNRYRELVQNESDGVLEDPHQLQALHVLDRLRTELLVTKPSESLPELATTQTKSSSSTGSSSSPSSTSLFGSWFGGGTTAASSSSTSSGGMLASATMGALTSIGSKNATKGVYLHGGVGCGKTFLMNLFYDSITSGPWAEQKQKIHFHMFMLRVHQEMHIARYSNNNNKNTQHVSDTILPAVIASMLQQGRLICFDEFQVTDVADALILQRLFTGLWQHGCVVVATSNRPPNELYLNGLQRDRFVPFIHLLEQKCHVVSMDESDTDYRLIQKQGLSSQVYFCGGKEARKELDNLFYQLVGSNTAVAPTALETQGRRVHIPQSALSAGLARFSFEDLCQKALGAADYLVIGQAYHTVFVENIPALTLNEFNWARRFITFVDSMYECHVKLIIHAKTPAAQIFQPGGDGSTTKQAHDEVFAFDRTVSRLEEMSSETYLQKKWKPTKKTKIRKQDGGVDSAAGPAELLSLQKATLDMEPSLADVKRSGGD